MKIKFKLLTKTASIPAYAHEGDSGMDARADEEVMLKQGETAKVRLGISADIPDGYEIQVRPRSGLSSKAIVCVLGTVDSGYKGEISAIITNHSKWVQKIPLGFKCCQLVVAKVERAEIEEVDDVGSSERGTDGFGSTGT